MKKSMRKVRKGAAQAVPRSIAQPPSIVASPVFNMTQRYVNALGSAIKVQRGDMLQRLVMVKTASSVGVRLCSGVRLNWLSVYSTGASSALTGATNVAVQWVSEFGPPKITADTSTSTAFPACLPEMKPPKESVAAFWSTDGLNESDTLFIITSPAGSIIDINFSFVLQDTSGGFPLTPTVTTVGGAASATVGLIGVPYLDHNAPSGKGTIQDWPDFQ